MSSPIMMLLKLPSPAVEVTTPPPAPPTLAARRPTPPSTPTYPLVPNPVYKFVFPPTLVRPVTATRWVGLVCVRLRGALGW